MCMHIRLFSINALQHHGDAINAAPAVIVITMTIFVIKVTTLPIFLIGVLILSIFNHNELIFSL